MWSWGLLIALALGSLVSMGEAADLKQEEQAIRHIIERATEPGGQTPYTDDAIFVSGAYDRALIGNEERQAARIRAEQDPARKRTNQKIKDEVFRIEVANSGDMAYEFSQFTLSFQNADRKSVEFKGEILRVWRKVRGDWKVAASFSRPNPGTRQEK